MVITLILSLAALGYCIWLLRKMAVEIIALRATLKALSTETATLANAFESVIWNVTVTPSATKTTTKKPRARVR
jgi:cell division protein FtsB